MKKLLPVLVLLLLTQHLFAQVPAKRSASLKPALALREVSGIVKDTTDEPVIGATIKIKTAKDSVSTTTNGDGVFVFKNVTSASFVITVTSIGYRPLVKRMLNNDAVPRLVLDPLVLRSGANELKEVVINGTPSITYKTDTVEYRASDYKVRPNSSVDELLKKMEGMEVGTDGTVTHQGQQVTKVRLNGKDYAGGDVAKAIQNLPADIVEKIQVVDDYGDEAARTGVKDGDPKKVLNITTRADRSVGNIVRTSAGAGSNERYEARVFVQRLNGNQQIGVIGNIRNTVNGVASTGILGSPDNNNNNNNNSSVSGGTTTAGGPALSYRDHWGKKVEVNGTYNYSVRDIHSINESFGERQYKSKGSDGKIFFEKNSDRQNNYKTHAFSFELEYSPDSANYFKFVPKFNYTATDALSNSSNIQTGLLRQDVLGQSNSFNRSPSYSGIAFYQHIFKKPRRNLSFQLSYSRANNSIDNEQNNHILYYRTDSTNILVKDSLVHRYIARDNISNNVRGSFTYVEPLSAVSQIELNAQINRRSYDNTAFTDNIGTNGLRTPVDSLSNVFNYIFTERRFALNYRINQKNYNLSLGVTAVPTTLEGIKVSQGNVQSRRNYFNVIPIFRYQYVWSRQQRASIHYSGSPNEPDFNQIQPVRDVSNPQNPVVGNPDLKPSFRHNINLQYNNYISNSRLNLSANVNTAIIANQITTNNVRIPDVVITKDPITGKTNISNSFKNETRFMNLNGTYGINGNYNVSKQLDDRKYSLSLNGNVGYSHNVGMTDNLSSLRTIWRINERFGPRINPNESIEVNPFVAYDISRSFFSIVGDTTRSFTNVRTTALAIDGRFFFMKEKSFTFGYSASKNFVRGLPSNNPLVINAYIEKEFFKRKLLTVNFQVFDILKQNSFVSQVITENSVTNTRSNALSRYFMFTVRANLQKWSGSPSHKGKKLMRRGDGSFIDN